jgi:hypothetical protein
VQIEAVEAGLYHVRPGEVRYVPLKPVLRVFNLSKYLSGKPDTESARAIEDLMRTVDLAFDMLNDAKRSANGSKSAKSKKPLNSQFHPGTKLMLVIGSPEDVDVFHEVTSQLLEQPRAPSRGSYGMGMRGGMDDGSEGDGMEGAYGGTFQRRSSGKSKAGMGGGAPGGLSRRSIAEP